MNYIFLIPGKKFGAIELQTINRALEAKQRGYRSIVVCNNNSYVHHYANSLGLHTEFIHITYPYFDLFSIFELSLICQKYEIDVCVVAVSKFLAIALTASKLCKCKPRVFLYKQLQSGITKLDIYHNQIYSRLTGAVTLTEQMRLELEKTTVLKAEKIKVIPYGIDVEKYDRRRFNKEKVRNIFKLPQDKYIIGNISRISKTQDQIMILRAFHTANIPNSFLVFCGTIDAPNQEYHLKIVQETENLRLLDKVKFIPCTDRTAELFNSFDVYLLSSRTESYSFAVLEALASGLPVIAVNSGGIPEIIKHNYNGFLIVRSDFEAAAKYLLKIYNNPDIVNKFRERNFSLVRHKFEKERQADAFFDFIK